MAWNTYPTTKLIVDGDFGRYTIFALQYQLNHRLFKTPYKKISQDGVFGRETALRLQHYLRDQGYYKYALDGNAGARTWSALQSLLLNKHNLRNNLQPENWTWPDPKGLGLNIQRWLNILRGPLA